MYQAATAAAPMMESIQQQFSANAFVYPLYYNWCTTSEKGQFSVGACSNSSALNNIH